MIFRLRCSRLVPGSNDQWRILLPVAVASGVALAAIVFGLGAAAEHSDVISVERQVRVAERAVDASVDELPAAQVPFAVWDEMVLKTRGPPDVAWFMANVGGQFAFAYPGARTYVVDPDDRFVYGYHAGRAVPAVQFAKLRPQLQYFMDAARGRVVPEDYAHSRLFGVGTPPQPTGPKTLRRVEYVVYAAHLARIDGRPAAVSVMRIVPTEWAVEQRRGREPLLITVRLLNEHFLELLSQRNLIDRPRFAAEASALPKDEVSLVLRGIHRQPVASLRWRPELPGTRLRAQLQPYAVGAVTLLIATMLVLALVLSRTLSRLASSERRARWDATHDALTALPNRVVLLRQLTEALARKRKGRTAALLLMDLDRFKEANDTYGHAAGDSILREVGARLRSAIEPGLTVTRLGGDEFALIADTEDRRQLGALCARIVKAIRQPFLLAEGTASIGISIGAAPVSALHTQPEDVLRSADRALYLAKASGRGTFVVDGAPDEDG